MIVFHSLQSRFLITSAIAYRSLVYPKLKACLKKIIIELFIKKYSKPKNAMLQELEKKTAVVDVTVTPLIHARHVLKSSLASWKQQNVSEG